MIDARLFLKLQEVFADSFNHTKEVERIDRIAGPWGIEEYRTCIYDTVTLSESAGHKPRRGGPGPRDQIP